MYLIKTVVLLQLAQNNRILDKFYGVPEMLVISLVMMNRIC